MSSSRARFDSGSQQRVGERSQGAQNRSGPEAPINGPNDLERTERENLKRQYWKTVRAEKDGAEFPEVWSANDDNLFRGWVFRQKRVKVSARDKHRLQDMRTQLRERTVKLGLSSDSYSKLLVGRWTEVYRVRQLDCAAINKLLTMDNKAFTEWWRVNVLSKMRNTAKLRGIEVAPKHSPTPPPRMHRELCGEDDNGVEGGVRKSSTQASSSAFSSREPSPTRCHTPILAKGDFCPATSHGPLREGCEAFGEQTLSSRLFPTPASPGCVPHSPKSTSSNPGSETPTWRPSFDSTIGTPRHVHSQEEEWNKWIKGRSQSPDQDLSGDHAFLVAKVLRHKGEWRRYKAFRAARLAEIRLATY